MKTSTLTTINPTVTTGNVRVGTLSLSGSTSRSLGDDERQQSLLRVQAIFGLVEDGGLRAVDDLLGDLLAVVRRQAVEDERLLTGCAQETGVDPVTGEIPGATLLLSLMAHRRPNVRVEDVRTGDGTAHVIGHLDRAAGFGRAL